MVWAEDCREICLWHSEPWKKNGSEQEQHLCSEPVREAGSGSREIERGKNTSPGAVNPSQVEKDMSESALNSPTLLLWFQYEMSLNRLMC